MPILISLEETNANLITNEKDLTIESTCTSSKIESPCLLHATKLDNTENSSQSDNKEDSENKIRKNFFPRKLMRIITSNLFEDCITWDSEGKSFAIIDFVKFATRSNLSGAAYKKESFVRKLNRWGFRMHKTEGFGYYSHPLFLRNKPWLCERMRCKKTTIALSKSRAEKTTEMSNTTHIDEITSRNNHTHKRKISDLEDNVAELGHKFDRPGQLSLIEVFFRYFTENCGVHLAKDNKDNQLRKFALLTHLRNEEMRRIANTMSSLNYKKL